MMENGLDTTYYSVRSDDEMTRRITSMKKQNRRIDDWRTDGFNLIAFRFDDAQERDLTANCIMCGHKWGMNILGLTGETPIQLELHEIKHYLEALYRKGWKSP